MSVLAAKRRGERFDAARRNEGGPIFSRMG
jgi:hypothetical protein